MKLKKKKRKKEKLQEEAGPSNFSVVAVSKQRLPISSVIHSFNKC